MTAQAVVTGTYDLRVVTLSIAIAVLTSYAALHLAARIVAASGRTRANWLIVSALAQGIGIWSMHYTGMLAFTLPVPTRYDWRYALLSFVWALSGAALAVWVVSRSRMRVWRIALAGTLMAAGTSLFCAKAIHFSMEALCMSMNAFKRRMSSSLSRGSRR